MKKYDYIFFDFDGTLSDSAPGIVNSVVCALERMGTPVGDRAALKKYVGPPLFDSFRDFAGYSQTETERAVKYFREYYGEHGINENEMYPGIDTLLRALGAAGRTCVVATSKPEHFAQQICARYGIDTLFAHICGSTMDETRTRKAEVVAYALECCGNPDPARVVMVGDRLHDVAGAKANGLDCIGVLYGYGSRDELVSAGADAIAEDIPALTRLLL